jgi:hypothetical protein
VLFAFSILSMVIVGAMAIMNRGTVASQRALETTLVRSQIDAQATTLRFLHDAYVAKFQPNISYDAMTPAGQWAAMSDGISAVAASSFANITSCPAAPSGSFIMDAANAKYLAYGNAKMVPSVTSSRVTYGVKSGALSQSQGIWVEAIRSPQSPNANQQNTRYIDFHIMACWESPGRGVPMTIGTIVRLYEPQS